jgi:glyoxylase-like metal-dependent hydrolase (beta-lactamase superfamily II)
MATYTGDVFAGGPPQVRELPELVVTKVCVGALDTNCYLLRCRATGKQAMIDAAAEPDLLLDLVGTAGLDLVITTHRHADHVGALADVVAATGARTAAHRDDAGHLPIGVDVVLEHGDAVVFGSTSMEAIHLAGHTPGGLALLYDDPEGHGHLFTGDSLFPGGVGATGGDAQAFRQLLRDVRTRVFDVLSDETWVYPGHGADTTLGRERPSLEEWRSRGW